ncbi:hypothetical protein D9613_010490 [Agrocybe pediades]|uniref:Autophagy-related protein 27 n=1 Tax=Agrocybe pediades TaxID=84607 RepID=A0A8H4QH41_9AGAR|nr:hypothetical protein D9613_010490 [Agrocybe pediades]
MPHSQSLLITASFLLFSQLSTIPNGRAAAARVPLPNLRSSGGSSSSSSGGGGSGVIHKMMTITTTPYDLERWHHDCELEVNGYGYDLCPLMGKVNLIEGRGLIANEDVIRGEGPSSGRRFYEVALGGLSASAKEGRSSTEYIGTSCAEGTWVCMLDMGYVEVEHDEDTNSEFVRKTLRATPIAGNSPRSSPRNCRVGGGGGEQCNRNLKAAPGVIASVTLEEDGNENPLSLRLALHGNEAHSEESSSSSIAAEITVSCADVEYLRYRGDDGGVHSFSWATPQGCPMKLPRPNATPGSEFAIMQEPSPEDENKEPNEAEGDDDLLPQDNGRARRRIAFIVVGFILLSAFIFVFASSARARHFANEKARGVTYATVPLLSTAAEKIYPIALSIQRIAAHSLARVGAPGFRQGSSRLVQWAQEDMSLGMEGGQDVMVNGSDAYDHLILDQSDLAADDGWNADGMDEYIPLRTSPGRSRRVVRSYGTTPDVETFAERGVGVKHGIARFFGR